MANQSGRFYRFGKFSLDAGKSLLMRAGEPIGLSPKVMETLLVLVENRERVLTKDELLDRIWGDTAVEEGGLARNISILRKALGERHDDHQYIVTAPGRGYQWVASVRESENGGQDENEPIPVHPQALHPVSGFSANRRRIRAAAIALGIVVLVLVLTQGYWNVVSRPPIQSIAVLPLKNLSGDVDQEYLADGITEELIDSLARIRTLRVVSRTSTMRFKGSTKPLLEIARELNVDAVLTGSVHQTNGRVKIMIQLSQGSTDTYLWTSEYESGLAEIQRLNSDVTQSVAEKIRAHVSQEERSRLDSAASINPDAYQEYLKGRFFLWKYIEEDRLRAIQHFERAVEIDSNYAQAYAALSHAWWMRGVLGPLTLAEVAAPARAAAQKALDLDSGLAEAHVAQAYLQGVFDWNWTEADKAMRRALDLGPNSPDVRYIATMLLMAQGRLAEAEIQIRTAAELDPLSAQVQSSFGRVLFRARKLDEAAAHLKQAIELEPRNSTAISRLGDVYAQMSRYDDAIAEYEKAFPPGADAFKGKLAQVYAQMGRKYEARKLLAEIKGNVSNVAQILAVLGDKDEAFRALFRSVDERSDWLIFVKGEPGLDSLRSDPRWNELLRRMNLETETSLVMNQAGPENDGL